MNTVFLIVSVMSLAFMTINSPEAVFPTMIDGAAEAITLVVKLLAIYSVWFSVLKMMEKTGADKLIARTMKPLTKRLFRGESEEAYVAISLNISSNLLGMGGVATPAGIQAMSLMHKGGDTASPNMILFFVIAASSLQIIPATVIALRAGAGSANAADIFLPTVISSVLSTAIGIALCKIFASFRHEKADKKINKRAKPLKNARLKKA
jgi:spore maturation protein A